MFYRQAGPLSIPSPRPRVMSPSLLPVSHASSKPLWVGLLLEQGLANLFCNELVGIMGSIGHTVPVAATYTQLPCCRVNAVMGTVQTIGRGCVPGEAEVLAWIQPVAAVCCPFS